MGLVVTLPHDPGLPAEAAREAPGDAALQAAGCITADLAMSDVDMSVISTAVMPMPAPVRT